ncbi:MAG TPA: peptidylprolyl isomerase [Casimicrobiaceae bacterium]|jgi:peptidyl-prolyl cis-trans isomerase C|nr:peptidylprolyl isomerase [Casimicrobiaceae bacterium]HWD36103.1 peptidylprolyl isomerase [Casimicrobiaceae bacterium]
MKRTLVAVAVTAALCTGGALAQTPAAPAKTAPKAAAAAAKPATATSSDKVLYNQAQYDLVLKEQIAQGQKDTPELRNAIKDRLNMVQLLAGEAKKQGIDKNADVRNQMDINAQQILASAYISDWLKKNPVPEADMRKEYDQIKSQIGDKEYKVRHILVKTEDQAKEIIAELQKGAKFDELAKARSEDPGSKEKGGDLDWNSPANFVKPFGDAMKATPKGKFTPQPVQTQFGWHVIEVDDVRDAKVPTFEEVKPQLQERMKQEWVQKHIAELRTKNGV